MAPCANATATVTVAEQAPANAGTSSSVSVCSNGVAINLLDSLGGTPAGGGAWSGGLVGGMYDPAVNAPGPYTYTITGVAPCANATATVTVTEVAPANAGTSSSVSVCANGVPINLLDSLGGTLPVAAHGAVALLAGCTTLPLMLLAHSPTRSRAWHPARTRRRR
ncbi:MAG: hypothetical protein IPF78_08605 [Flavobacteriales bacterium]|nr:hypothetical protein [Flavobacteriales bacterium]